MKKITTVFTMLLLIATTASAQWAGKGTGISMNGQWYALYETQESWFSTISEHEYTLQAPGASMTFDVKCGDILWVWGGPLRAAQFVNNAWSDQLYEYGCAKKNRYYHSDVVSLDHNATKVKLYTTFGATGYKYFKNVIVPMASYIYSPSLTSLDFGTADKGTSDTRTFTVAWCNVPGFEWQVTGTNAADIEVSIDENAQAGSYNTSTITVKYNRQNAGDLDATLVLSNEYGSYSRQVSLTGYSVETDVTAKMRIDSKAKWGTFCAPFDVVIPEGVQAYTGELLDTHAWIRLTELEGAIPANTAVVVCADDITETTEWAFKAAPVETAGLESCFIPNLTGTEMDVPAGCYLLQNNFSEETQQNLVGLYRVSGEGFKLAANRCYLTKESESADSRSFIGFEPTDNDATAISTIASQTTVKADGKYLVNGQVIVVKAGKAYGIDGRRL